MFSNGFYKIALNMAGMKDMAMQAGSKLKGFASEAGKAIRHNPAARGAAIGAAGGAIGGAASAPEGEGFSGAAKGALLGAAGGAGVGHGISKLKSATSPVAGGRGPLKGAPAATRPPIEAQFRKISQYLPQR